VEVRRVELLSENLFIPASPSADTLLKFPYINAKCQALILGSSQFMIRAGTSPYSRSPLK